MSLRFRFVRPAAARLGGGPASLGGVRPGPHPGHGADVALQPHHAHAAGASPDAAVVSGGDRGPDGLVQGELA